MARYKNLFRKLIPSVKPSFKNFDNVPVKNLSSIKKTHEFIQAVGSTLKKNKKWVGAAVAGTATVTAAALWIENFIAANSGCFLLNEDDGTVCKVKELSCCQPESVDNVPFCKFNVFDANVCDNFVDDAQKDCCLEVCNCEKQDCLPNQKLECRRPNVGQALSFLADNAVSSLWKLVSPLWNVLYRWCLWILSVVGIIFAGWLLWIVYKRIRK